MEKTIFRLDKEISIMILSGITILFSFLSSYSQISNLISFLFFFLKSFVFIVVPLLVYILEKNCLSLKKVAGIYTSYFIINLFVTIIASISIIVPIMFTTLSDLVNLIILLSSLFIFIEQVLEYSDIKNKMYSKMIMKLIYLMGDFVAYPFLSFINRKMNKEDKRDE